MNGWSGPAPATFRIWMVRPDHPFMAHVQESRYLKAVFCRVLD